MRRTDGRPHGGTHRALVGALVVLVVAATAVLALHVSGPGPTRVRDAERVVADVQPGPVRERAARPESVGPAGDAADRAAASADASTLRGRVVEIVRTWPEETPPGPVADATVELVEADLASPAAHDVFAAPAASAVATTSTDSDGRFTLPAQDGPAWFVRVTKPGYRPAVRRMSEIGEIGLRGPAGCRVVEVLDRDDRPVPGALVLSWEGPASDDEPATPRLPAIRAVADAHGLATIEADADTELVIVAPGFALRRADVDPDAPRTVVRLGPGTVVGGSVADTAGVPLAGVRVDLDRCESWDHQSARTDADGRFQFDSVDATDASWTDVVVDAPGRVRTEALARPGDTDVRLVVPRAGRIAGVVVKSDASPAVGAWVVVGRQGVHAAEDGAFVFDGVPPGRHSVGARWTADEPGDERSARAVAEVAEGATVDGLRLVLEPDSAISWVSAQVRSSDGSPQPWIWVNAIADDREVGTSAADAGGRAVVRVARPPGTLVVLRTEMDVLGAPDRAVESSPVATAERPPGSEVLLELGPPAILSLRCVDAEGREIPASSVEAVPKGRDTAPDPRAIAVRIGARAVVTVSAPGRANVEVAVDPPHPPRREVVVLLPRAATVAGRLHVDDRTVDPADLKVQVATWSDGRWAGNETVRAESDGGFRVTGLAPGKVYVWVEEGTRSRARWFGPDLAAGETLDVGEVVVRPLRVVRGTVAADDGTPLGGAFVEVVRDDGRILGTTASGVTGAFEVALPPATPAALRVQRRGRATGLVAVPESGDRVRVVLAAEGTVELVLPAHVLHASFAVETDGSRPWSPDVEGPRTVDADHVAWRIRGLPAGPLTIRGVSGTPVPDVRVTLAPGESRSVTVPPR